MDAEVVAHAVLLRDAVQADPQARRVADLVVPEVGRVPARHRALLDAVLEPPLPGRLQQGHEAPLVVREVLVHVEGHVASHEPADGLDAQGDGGVHDLHHPVVLHAPEPLVAHEHVVEVADVGEAHARGRERGLDAPHARGVERLQDVEVVGDGVEHGLGGDVRQLLGQRRRELDAVHAEVVGEADPVLDGQVGVLLALLTRGELLESGGEDAHPHVFGLEFRGHDWLRYLSQGGTPRIISTGGLPP